MGKETIMLAKKFNVKKLDFPVYVSEKLDGVAARFDCKDGVVTVQSRQGKPILSVQHICDDLTGALREGASVVGELYIKGQAFKDISGKVRSHDPQPELMLYIYDWFWTEQPDALRFSDAHTCVLEVSAKAGPSATHCVQLYAQDESAMNLYIESIMASEHTEGCMIRSGDHHYFTGKRSWGMMKHKKQHTVDLEVVSFEEAISKDGEPLGMVGRINCKYKDRIIGVGPGKMNHTDRKLMWGSKSVYVGSIIEVKYMPDPGYQALREPRFIQFRPDKTEESYE